MFPPQGHHHMYNRHTRPMVNHRWPMNYPHISKTPQTSGMKQLLNQLPISQSSLASFANKSVGGISQTLNNVQQVLKVIETVTPIVKQYGPMVKNLPSLYRMMKVLQEIDDTEEEQSKENVDVLINEDHIEDEKDAKDDIVEEREKQRYSRESIPRLYI